jgi:four helix bundle suffix protein
VKSVKSVVNILACLIHQTNYLLDQQLRRLEKDFVEPGGLRENMTLARSNTAPSKAGGKHERRTAEKRTTDYADGTDKEIPIREIRTIRG